MKIHTANKLICLVFSIYCLAPFNVYAKEVCEFTGSSMQDNDCSYKRFQIIERMLNKRYKELLAELDEITRDQPERLATLKQKFITAQKTWVTFRESECRAIEVWYTNGKLQPSLYYGCMERLAKERLMAFDSFTGYQS